MNQRQLVIALTRGLLLVSFGMDILDLLAVQLISQSEAWTTLPLLSPVGFTLGSNLEWAQRGLWAASAYLLLGPLAGLGLLNGPGPLQYPGWERTVQSLTRALLLSSGALIALTIISRTYGGGPSKVGTLVGALRAAVMTLTTLMLAIRIQPKALEARGENSVTNSAVVGAPAAVPRHRAPASAVFRRWWQWRSEVRSADWVFGGIVLLALGALGWRMNAQRTQENAFRALDECLAHADVSCANVALAQLSKLNVAGARVKVGALDTRLLAEGWTASTADSLQALQAEVGSQGLGGAEAFLALGDADAAHGESTAARGHWAMARGKKGVDAWIEARLTRLVAEETARAQDESDAQDARRSAEEARRVDDAARRATAMLGAVNGALERVELDFAAALEDAQEGRTESLQIRLRVLNESIVGLPQVAQTRFRAAFLALNDAGNAAQRLARTAQQRKRVRDAWYLQQLGAQDTADTAKLEQAVVLAQEQFKQGLALLRGLPIDVVQ
jgi:hypothetical protein